THRFSALLWGSPLCGAGDRAALFITGAACERHIIVNATQEIKYDGFRALAHIETGGCRLVSRNNHAYRSFRDLCHEISSCVKADNAVIDGDIVCMSDEGRPQFYELMRRRGDPYLYAFDLLWFNGADLRELPLHERKRQLRQIIPRSHNSRLRFSDHIEATGCELFRAACDMDLEGIVATQKHTL